MYINVFNTFICLHASTYEIFIFYFLNHARLIKRVQTKKKSKLEKIIEPSNILRTTFKKTDFKTTRGLK